MKQANSKGHEAAVTTLSVGGLQRPGKKKMKTLGTLFGLATVLLFSSMAQAQVNGSVPSGYRQFYSIPGAVNNGGIATVITCTNGSPGTASVAVEVFGPAGGGSLNTFSPVNIASGATVAFGTASPAGMSIDVNLLPGVVTKGSARVLAAGAMTGRLWCSAYLADVISNPPSFAAPLTVVAGVKQK